MSHQYNFIDHPDHREEYPKMKDKNDVADAEEMKEYSIAGVREDWSPPQTDTSLATLWRLVTS